MKGFMKSKLALALVALILLATAIAIPLSGLNMHSASANDSTYPANIEYDHNTPYGWYEQSNLTNPNINAVDINMNWSDVEPQQGTFNWAPADQEMADWSSHGKKFTLIIRYVHELKQKACSNGNQWMPDWELARIPNFCSSGGEYVPDYFDATFQSDLQAYVTAIAQHVAASPYISSLEFVRIGVGMAGESLPCVNCNAADMQQLVNWGYSITTWAQWQKAMLTSYTNIFSSAGLSSTPLIYPLGDNDVDPSTNQTVSHEVGYWAAAQGFGVGQEGLHNASTYANGAAVKIAQYVRKNYPTAYIQFQTVSTVANASDVQGDVAIANGAGAFSIEWYNTDSINPTYQPYFQQWQQMVDCTNEGDNCPTPTPSVFPSPSVTPSPSPSPGPTLAQDTFQRSDQSLWGTASNGQKWGADANKKSNFSITQDSGQIVGSGTSANGYTAILGPTSTTDAQVQVSGTLSNYGGNTLGVVTRLTDSNNFYKAYITGTNLVIQKKVTGKTTNLKSIAFPAKPGTSYTLLLSAVGTTLSAKVWPTGSTPPDSWMLSTTDTSLSSGSCGLLVYLTSGIIADVSSFQAVQAW